MKTNFQPVWHENSTVTVTFSLSSTSDQVVKTFRFDSIMRFGKQLKAYMKGQKFGGGKFHNNARKHNALTFYWRHFV